MTGTCNIKVSHSYFIVQLMLCYSITAYHRETKPKGSVKFLGIDLEYDQECAVIMARSAYKVSCSDCLLMFLITLSVS